MQASRIEVSSFTLRYFEDRHHRTVTLRFGHIKCPFVWQTNSLSYLNTTMFLSDVKVNSVTELDGHDCGLEKNNLGYIRTVTVN